MMKKSIVTVLGITLSALAAVVTSCTNDEVIASAERHGGKVGFGFSVEQMEGDGAVNTRAAAIVSQVMDGSGDSPVYLTTATTGYVNSRISGSSAATKGVSIENAASFYDNFGLFIYEYDATSNWDAVKSTANPNMDNQKLSQSSGWITDKYWPGKQKRLTFFAYAPHSTEYTSVSVLNTTGAPTLSYTVPATVSDQKDLLVTKHSDTHPTQDIQGDKNKVVNMAFYHALTAVQFKIGGTMAPCTIKTITVEGVNSKGTYNFSNDAWTSQSTPATYTISPNYEVSSNSGRNNIFTNTSDMLMLLMPQTLPNDAKITITINDGQERTLTLPINGQVWQAGHSVTYSLSTASEDDTYQISVTDATLNEKGGSATCSVESYRQTYYGTQIPVGWTATYHVDEETTEQTGNSEYVTSFKSSSDEGLSSTTSQLTATLDKLYFVSDETSNTYTKTLREASLIGNTTSPHNLSNQTDGGETVQNTANCYIVNAPGYYRIPMVYGNGIKNSTTNTESIDKGSSFVNSDGSTITKAYLKENNQTPNNAVLVWQDAYHLIDPKSVKINEDFIEFYIPKKYICEGNAVLAARDNNDNILWSWHIWVTGEELSSSTNVKVINRYNTQYNFMKLPLGFCHEDIRRYPTRNIHITITQNGGSSKQATATIVQSSESLETLGVNAPYFQYGRKDPFCPSNGNATTYTNKTLYDSQIDGFTGYKTNNGANQVSVSQAIKEPYIFHYIKDADWCITHSNEFWDVGNTATGLYDKKTNSGQNYNHDSQKTVYDPSPVGYKTPEPNAWTRFTTDGNNYGSENKSKWNVKGDFSSGWNFYTQEDKEGVTDFWHALGYRDVYSGRPTGTAALNAVGSSGNYWSCGPYSEVSGRLLYFGAGGVYPQNQSFRAYGFSVRPVSE